MRHNGFFARLTGGFSFPNAVLHWISADVQAKVLQNIYNALKPQGVFVCEFGGYGCTNTMHRAQAGKAHGTRTMYGFNSEK